MRSALLFWPWRLWKAKPRGTLARQFAVGLGLVLKRNFQGGIRRFRRHPLELERVLQVFSNHLHGALSGLCCKDARLLKRPPGR